VKKRFGFISLFAVTALLLAMVGGITALAAPGSVVGTVKFDKAWANLDQTIKVTVTDADENKPLLVVGETAGKAGTPAYVVGTSTSPKTVFPVKAPIANWVSVKRGWVSVKRGRINGLVAARPCSGPTAWIVEHLVTPHRDEEPCSELLERAAAYAERHGAQRLFLPIPNEWHLMGMVRHSGFVPCTQLLLLTLPGRSPLLGVEPKDGFRPRIVNDDYRVFRLYNATTPAEVRLSIGMTLQQWQDAQEPQRKGTRELVLEQGDGMKGWVRLDHHGKWTKVRVTIDTDWEADPRALVAFVLAETGSRSVWWEVPEYQGILRLLLERVGFEVAGSYRLMVKLLAARVREPSLAPAPTAG